jgi:hypothetical protein
VADIISNNLDGTERLRERFFELARAKLNNQSVDEFLQRARLDYPGFGGNQTNNK